jgi:Transposase domain (DUF772)
VFGSILEVAMAHRSIGQERLGFAVSPGSVSSLDDLSRLIDWDTVAGILGPVHARAKGEPAWPPLAMFKALLLSVWYDLSDVKLVPTIPGKHRPHAENFPLTFLSLQTNFPPRRGSVRTAR